MKSSTLSIPLLLAVLVLACGPAPTPEATKPTQLAVASEGALSVELLTFGPLVVGQNRVFYQVTHDGAPAVHAEIAQKPMMQMATMKHACPLQNPEHAPNADGLFEGLLVFTMPTMEMDKWSLSLDVEVAHGAPIAVNFGEVTVADSAMKKVLTRDGKKIVLTVGYPEAPRVGRNPVVITAHQAKDMMMMEYLTVDDLVFTVTPEMPSMGHGSSGNENPVRGEDGLYRGTAVYSMSGDWVLHLGVAAGDTDLGTFDFALDL